jgi:hypothetical protein
LPTSKGLRHWASIDASSVVDHLAADLYVNLIRALAHATLIKGVGPRGLDACEFVVELGDELVEVVAFVLAEALFHGLGEFAHAGGPEAGGGAL